MTSCIDLNEVPLDGDGQIVAFSLAGERTKTIDPLTRTIAVEFEEWVEPNHVEVVEIATDKGAVSNVSEGEVLDFTAPVTIVVETSLSKYNWTVRATHDIERVFTFTGQVGQTDIRETEHFVLAYVPKEGVDRTKIKITEIKFAPEGSGEVVKVKGTEDVVSAGFEWDFSWNGPNRGRMKVVSEYTRGGQIVTENWTIHLAESSVKIEKADPFARRIYLEAFGQEGGENGFEYRTADSDDEWTVVPEEFVEQGDKGLFSAWIKGTTGAEGEETFRLAPETKYEVRATSNGESSDAVEVTTQGVRPFYGGGFEEWNQDGKLWMPCAKDAVWEAMSERGSWWWDSGNEGASVKESNTTPTESGEGCPANPTGIAARMESISVFSDLGIPAGGNIYFGQFAGVSGGTNGRCDIGHNWYDKEKGYVHKPSGMRGWFKYSPQPVNVISPKHVPIHPFYKEGFTGDKWRGSPDSLHICVALWADPKGRNIPFTVDTDPKKFVDFEVWDEGVLAYGSFISARPQSEWAEFEVEMDYFQTGDLPENTFLYVLLTSSKSCNYFIAGAKTDTGPGSTLWVDELELLYE